MKSILVYGDSNTWGQTDKNARYVYDVRWTTLLAGMLGQNYSVESAGLSGRLAGNGSTVEPPKRGKDAFEVVFRQAFPLDVVVIALGTNDIKEKYNLSAEQITEDLLWYAQWLENSTDYNDIPLETRVLYLLPPNFVYSQDGFAGNEQKRQEIIEAMQKSGKETLVMNDVELSSDGVHFSPEGHKQMAETIHNKLKEMGV